jgi:hypothetical protein
MRHSEPDFRFHFFLMFRCAASFVPSSKHFDICRHEHECVPCFCGLPLCILSVHFALAGPVSRARVSS